MTHYLIAFDRHAGRLVRLDEFADGGGALRARFECERRLAPGDDIEVVVLSSDSRATLERTHARYFESLSSLVERASTAARPRPVAVR